MNTIHWLSNDEHGEWDAFVTRHPRGLVYHLSAWKQLLETAFGHIRGRFLVLRNGDGQIQAGLPVYTVDSWLLGNRLVSVPFATMCDPLISTKEEFNLLWPAIEDASVKHRSQRIEIRIRHTNSDCLPASLTASTRYKHHYLPLDKPTDELFRSFNKSNICRAVKKAKQEGVIVEERQDGQSLRVFHSFLVATRRKHSLPPMPFAFFHAMYRSLSPDHVALYLAMANRLGEFWFRSSRICGLPSIQAMSTTRSGVSANLFIGRRSSAPRTVAQLISASVVRRSITQDCLSTRDGGQPLRMT